MDRPKRKHCKRRPRNLHYVGYVDDKETVEMIMKKFQVLDKILEDTKDQAPAGAFDSEQPLTEDQLEMVFKMTSNLDFDEEENPEYSDQKDYEFDEYYDEDDATESLSVADQDSYKDEFCIIKRRVIKSLSNSATKESTPTYLRLPSAIPLPQSLAKTILPYCDSSNIPPRSEYIETDIKSFDWKKLNQKFIGIILDVPWFDPDPEQESNPYMVNYDELSLFPMDYLMDSGFLFVWVEKQHIAACLRIADRWNLTYAEHLAWVQQNVDYSIHITPHKIFNKAKMTLLIFKKGDPQILHQRNVDVIFDIVRKDRLFTVDKPLMVYRIIEMMLFNNERQLRSRFLEVWGKKNYRRKNWTMIVQKEPDDERYLPKDESCWPAEGEVYYYL